MAAKKSKKKVFSATKAVKANARDRVGPPPASRILPSERPVQGRKQKYRPTLDHLLQED
ncbi:MAG TPA: hypothetical protein VHX63_05135 [Acidobacteriaceae bacterium]|nr:hypothetical protein [Acidobacteriaceae bacterium]